MNYVILITGLYLLALALLMKTKGTMFFIFFKFLPTVLSLVLLYHANAQLGWL